MKLTQLYESLPVEKHGNIQVDGNRVFVKDDAGLVDEYIMDGEGNLNLVRSDKAIVARVVDLIPGSVDKSVKVKAIEAKVGA